MPVSLRWLCVFVGLCLLVIGPFLLFGAKLEGAVVPVLGDGFGYLQAILIILLLASDILLPVPSSLIATYSGAAFGLVTGAIITWVGLMFAAIAGLILGRGIGAAVVTRVFSTDEMTQARRFFETYGATGLVLTRPVPVLAEVAAFGAGLGYYPMPRYLVIMGLANAGLSIVYANLGTQAQASGSLLILLGASILVPLIALVCWHLFRHIRR